MGMTGDLERMKKSEEQAISTSVRVAGEDREHEPSWSRGFVQPTTHPGFSVDNQPSFPEGKKAVSIK